LYNKLSYLNAFISINDNLNINIIIDNIGKFDDLLTISNHNIINLNTDIVTDNKKPIIKWIYCHLLKIIKPLIIILFFNTIPTNYSMRL